MKAIIYARCSTTEEKQDATLQVEPLEEFCKRYEWDYQTQVEYASGKDMKKRPVLQSILKQAYNKDIDVILVTKIDRLARSMQDFVQITMMLDTYGVRLIAKDQGIDTDQRNPASRLLMNVLAAMGEFERELIRDRVKSGIDKARRKGVKFGRKEKIFDVERARELTSRMSYRAAARAMGIDVNTLIRRVKAYTPGGMMK